jgi:hypothetical protein
MFHGIDEVSETSEAVALTGCRSDYYVCASAAGLGCGGT